MSDSMSVQISTVSAVAATEDVEEAAEAVVEDTLAAVKVATGPQGKGCLLRANTAVAFLICLQESLSVLKR